LSISSIAGAKGFAILLTPPNNLPESVKKHLNNYKIEHTYIIGGTGAINKSIESQVPSPTRISGKNRYETNKLILQKFSADLDFNNIFVSRGEGEDGFADSLSGGVLAAQYGFTNYPCKQPIT
jgi:putative cell wall-binding protein